MVGRRRRAPDVESADVRPLAYPAGRPPVAPPASAAGLSAGQPRAIAPPHTLTTPAQGRCPLSTTDPTSPQFFGAASAGAGAADVELSRRQRAHVDTWGMDTPHTEAPRLRLDVVAALAVVAAVALYAWATISTVRAARAALDRLGGPADAQDGYDVVGPLDDAQAPPPPPWAVSPLDAVDVEGPQAAPPAGTGADLPGGDALGGTIVALDDDAPGRAAA